MNALGRSFGALGWVGAACLAVAAGFVASCSADGKLESALVATPNPIVIGDVAWNDQVEREFVLHNRSDHDVTLNKWDFGCSCFLLQKSPASLLRAGESVTMRLIMLTGKTDARRFKKTLKIYSDDPVQPELHVGIEGEVIQYASIAPAVLDVGPAVAAADPDGKRIQARPGAGFALRVTKAEATDPRLDVSVVESAGGAGGADVVVRTKAGAKAGPIRAQVLVSYEVTGRGKAPYAAKTPISVTGEIQTK